MQPVSQPQYGTLLTRHCYDHSQGLVLIYWLQTAFGPVKLQIDHERALFFVEQNQTELAQAFLQQAQISINAIKPLPLKTFKQQPVSCFYFTYLKDFYAAREVLKQSNIKCYEDDFRPDDRFLMERFITSSMSFTGIYQQKRGFIEVTQGQAKSASYHTNLRMLSVDIECDLTGQLFSIAVYSDEIKAVFIIGDPQAYSQTEFDFIDWLADEKSLLQAFINWVTKYDPDIFIGWNVVNFDFDLLQKRCQVHHLTLALGRDGKAGYWRQHAVNDMKFYTLAGRVVLDGIDLLKTATYNFASFSLEHVAQELLGIGKHVVDVEHRVQEIIDNFHHNKLALARYNLQDCRLVWQIFVKTELLAFAQLRAELTGLELDRIGGSVAAFTNLYTPKLHRAGYIAPNMGDGVQDFVSPGGYVMDSLPGLYDNVLVLDFKSLYPSIIRTFNIDPMGMIEGMLQANAADNKTGLEPKHAAIQGYDGAYFSRDKHFLPDIIATLWQARDKAKKERNSALSQAIKIIMNSFYGVLGSTGCRYFDPRLAGSITKRSHDILKQTQTWIEQEQGFIVVYGDTDSIFVHLGEKFTRAECLAKGKELADFINQKWQAFLQTQHHIESQLEIEFETHFSKFLMPTIRGLDVGTKKRYAGLVIDDNNQQNIIFKGLESVRSDWTELAKVFQKELYHRVFNHLPIADYVLNMVNKTYAGEFDDLLIYRKRIRRKLTEYVKNVPPHIKAARAADEKNAQLGLPLKYQKRTWIEYLLTTSGPQAKEYLTAPIDHQLYIDKQLKAVADGILPFVNTSFEQITDQQLNLF